MPEYLPFTRSNRTSGILQIAVDGSKGCLHRLVHEWEGDYNGCDNGSPPCENNRSIQPPLCKLTNPASSSEQDEKQKADYGRRQNKRQHQCRFKECLTFEISTGHPPGCSHSSSSSKHTGEQSYLQRQPDRRPKVGPYHCSSTHFTSEKPCCTNIASASSDWR
ncbi:hypothetical protein D3C78_907640 [compost metagenome]